MPAATAGTKPVRQNTYAWGTISAAPNATVFTEAMVNGVWSRSREGTTDARGYYVLPLTYGSNSAGRYQFRVGVLTKSGTQYSAPFTLVRTATISASNASSRPIKVTTNVWGTVTGAPGGSQVWTDALVNGNWSRSRQGVTATNGSFTLPLTYGVNQPGTYRFRVGVSANGITSYSSTVTLVRVAFTASIANTTSTDVQYTYRAGCPVGPSGLSTITMTYWDFTAAPQTGKMIVRRKDANDVVNAFRDGFNSGFQIRQMRADVYFGKDVDSMKNDNTSAFNCRQVTGNPYAMSPHSYGYAIDINPVENPYRDPNGVWYPSTQYSSTRPANVVGMVYASSPMTRALTNRGFDWFSGWDWQHFERP